MHKMGGLTNHAERRVLHRYTLRSGRMRQWSLSLILPVGKAERMDSSYMRLAHRMIDILVGKLISDVK